MVASYLSKSQSQPEISYKWHFCHNRQNKALYINRKNRGLSHEKKQTSQTT